ncbi:MAG: hypothetical protein WA981_16110 [Glaciecola sp.]
MKLNKTLTALAVSASLGLSGQAFAEGTIAGTDITNTVTLGYTVNTVEQTDLTQSATFKVDTRVEFALTMDETETVKITPKGKGFIASYTLTSTSNDELGFALSSADLGTGTQTIDAATAFDVTDTVQLQSNISIYVENGANSGYQEAEDTSSVVSNLAADGTAEIYVVVDTAVPDTFTDADIASIALTATAKLPDGTTDLTNNNNDVFVAGTKQFVIVTSAVTKNTAFEVGTAKFTDPDDATNADKFTIDVTVINDPLCDTGLSNVSSNDYSDTGAQVGTCPDMPAAYRPKAIPGAMVKYTLKAKNSGSIKADDVKFSEDLANIADADGDSNKDLVQNSIANVEGSSTNTSATVTENTTNTNILDVDFDVIEPSDVVTITFTAIVE